MPNDIKSLLDNIIDDTDNSYPEKVDTSTSNPALTFDKGSFREKLSLGVLRDMITAMMGGHTEDMDGMIDDAIIKHIACDYNGSCYDYLCAARDRRKSPMLGDVIQEIDNAVEDADEHIKLTKDTSDIKSDSDVIRDLANNVPDYDTFTNKLGENVKEKIISSVTADLVKNNKAPKFRDTLAVELKAVSPSQPTSQPESDSSTDTPDLTVGDEDMMSPKTESVIITAATKMISESYFSTGNKMEVDEAMNRAICEYCLTQLDLCFTLRSSDDFYDKYIYSR